jgi:hypothetical protein
MTAQRRGRQPDTLEGWLEALGTWHYDRADATSELLQQLQDDSRWIIRRGVPIFPPHVRRDQSGRERYRVTERDLADIGHNCRARQSTRGVVGLLTIGHRPLDRHVPEADVVRYAKPVGYVVIYHGEPFGAEDTSAEVTSACRSGAGCALELCNLGRSDRKARRP